MVPVGYPIASQEVIFMKLPDSVKNAAKVIDKAIELGLTAAYPTVFNLPAPENGVQWKEKVKVGAKLVRTAVKDIAGAVVDEWRKK